mmetsp:Transcript_58745/g.117995  ORF Transcript_58745/g.117995 Transcript_58745/m.117995 type:complete len:451 (-) Transcript_58745:126-1478(-)|eukprot:CAMPEP_0171680410 /NCGR_PEP_ID=MMETSP0990-20121206/56808_1 /TAXON_ID=483369 /ORGANISM="non described non described, Strain CCMP2098" /LENGTH=450 /DNA_ID=CAMNT_0012267365 /DNA_START=91 /DNA_END=1443 /DNA_ORIENTATION=+
MTTMRQHATNFSGKNLHFLSVLVAFCVGATTHRFFSSLVASTTTLRDVLRSLDPGSVLASNVCTGSVAEKETCCAKKVYNGQVRVEICARAYKQDFEERQVLYDLLEEQREGWVEGTYLSSDKHNLFGWEDHNLTSLGDCLASKHPLTARPHIALIGDSHSRKRYLALTDMLGHGVGEEEVHNCGPCHDCNGTCAYHCPEYLCKWGVGWEAHMHYREFILPPRLSATGERKEPRSLVVSYAFWYKFEPDKVYEVFEEKLKRLKAVTGRPVTAVFVNAGHWHLTRPSALDFCVPLQRFLRTSLTSLLSLDPAPQVLWYSSGPVDYRKLDIFRAENWHPRMEMGFYQCSQALIAEHNFNASWHSSQTSAATSSEVKSIPFVDVYLPGRNLMHKMSGDGYHASPLLAKFQVQLGLNHLCPPLGSFSEQKGGFSHLIAARAAALRPGLGTVPKR